MYTSRFFKSLLVASVLVLLSSCNLASFVPPSEDATEESVITPEGVVPLPEETQVTEEAVVTQLPLPVIDATEVYKGKFADYKPVEYMVPNSFGNDYSLPINLNLVNNLSDYDLSDAQKVLLSQNGFVVRAPTSDPNRRLTEFYQGYERLRYYEDSKFITTDSIFHVYHLVFDKMLRDLERNYFIETLNELTTTMVAATTAQYQELQGSPLEDAALRNLAFFSIAAQLLGTGDAILPEAQPFVDAELALINNAVGVDISPLWAHPGQPADLVLREDYSQYIPRGHYTRSPELEKYFRAMMWYGRMTYRLKDSQETQRALLITRVLRSTTSPKGNSAISLWQQVYDPTVFIVGKADDLGVYEYGVLSDKVFGEDAPLTSFADQALLATFTELVKQLPPPQVNSMWVWIWQETDDVTLGFRFMGQRFTLDQYVFGQLMWRNVGTLDNPRDLPKALDFFAAQGSETALTILEEMGETEYLNYSTQMAKVQSEVAQLGLDSWTQNLYWSWLYALQPLFEEKGPEYPAFMRTDAWAKKDLQAALSSWTELKHDTILYSKQVMAEMGGGGQPEPPKGYIEPNPEAYARLLALAKMTQEGLQNRNLLDETTKGNLGNLIEELTFLLRIAERELNGETLSEDDYWQINYYGGWLESITIASADSDEGMGRMYLEDQKSPVVADVATGINRVLEEGVGYPTYIFVVLPDQPYRIGIGVVYTYYEFQVEPGDRMTDETWRALLESPNAPDMPEWTQAFIER